MAAVAPDPPATLVDEEAGFLGPGFVSGSFSADGISDDIFASLGNEEGVVVQVCTKLSCLLSSTFVRSPPSVYWWQALKHSRLSVPHKTQKGIVEENS